MNDPIHIISLGAGVQSSAMALMAAKGELGISVDFAVFADTGDEPDEVYDWLATLKRLLPFKVIETKSKYGKLSDNLLKWGFSQIPCFRRGAEGKPGKGRRQCTRYWKIRPIDKAIREETRTVHKKLSPGRLQVLKGISTDEADRAKDSQSAGQTAVFPLLDKGISRNGCKAWLTKEGLAAPKSACFFCPLKDQESWARTAENPKLWPKVLAIDKMLNERGEFLHPSCEPMESKPFLNASKWKQVDLFRNECEGLCGV